MANVHSAAEPLEEVVVRAFAPIHKRALGMAVGLICGALVFVLTAFHILAASPEAANITLLANYFYGYHVTWQGAFVGAWWGGVAGFVAGWFFGFVRNFALATWLLYVRARSDLSGARDFLDHI